MRSGRGWRWRRIFLSSYLGGGRGGLSRRRCSVSATLLFSLRGSLLHHALSCCVHCRLRCCFRCIHLAFRSPLSPCCSPIYVPSAQLSTPHPFPPFPFPPLSQYQNPNPVPVLHILAVDPSHQRQGLGTKLIAPGLEAADRAGAKAYVEASSKGLPLYLKYGWVPVDEMVIDLTPYGGEGIARQKFLMREPGVGSV